MRRRLPDAEVTLLAQHLQRDRRCLRLRFRERFAHDLFVADAEVGIVESHFRGETPKDLRVWQRFAERLDRARIEHHVKMSVRLVQIFVLELRRGGKKDVGVISRVRLKMFEHNREQIFAFQPIEHALLVRCNCPRITVVNNNRLYRRIRAPECFPKLAHVDRSRMTRNQIRTFETRIVVFKKSTCAQNRAATRIAPRSD